MGMARTLKCICIKLETNWKADVMPLIENRAAAVSCATNEVDEIGEAANTQSEIFAILIVKEWWCFLPLLPVLIFFFLFPCLLFLPSYLEAGEE